MTEAERELLYAVAGIAVHVAYGGCRETFEYRVKALHKALNGLSAADQEKIIDPWRAKKTEAA